MNEIWNNGFAVPSKCWGHVHACFVYLTIAMFDYMYKSEGKWLFCWPILRCSVALYSFLKFWFVRLGHLYLQVPKLSKLSLMICSNDCFKSTDIQNWQLGSLSQPSPVVKIAPEPFFFTKHAENILFWFQTFFPEALRRVLPVTSLALFTWSLTHATTYTCSLTHTST